MSKRSRTESKAKVELEPVGDLSPQFKCSICYEMMVEPMITPCKCLFCKECILESLKSKLNCPLCRKEIKDSNSLLPLSSNDQAIGFRVNKHFTSPPSIVHIYSHINT